MLGLVEDCDINIKAVASLPDVPDDDDLDVEWDYVVYDRFFI